MPGNIGTNSAQAHTTKVHVAKHRYYKANGVLHWIGNHAKVTQYHPNPAKKRKWQAAVRYWKQVRHDSWLILHPEPTARGTMRVLVTAYCLNGIMANGHQVHWGAIATDSSLIPLGTRVYVPGYGMATAEDTGGAVQGAHIDEWHSSCSEAMRSTRHETITIY